MFDTLKSDSFVAQIQRVPLRRAAVVLADEDAAQRRAVTNHFFDHEIDVTSATSRVDVQHYVSSGNCDLVILDCDFAAGHGLDLLRELRPKTQVPIIITTGHRHDEIDRVIGLELGADDYISRPCGLRELLARVRVILRRAEMVPAPARVRVMKRYAFGGWLLEQGRRRLSNPAGANVALSNGEYALLVAFLDAPMRPLSREYLMRATRKYEDICDRAIDVKILRLRRKMEEKVGAPRFIVTQRNAGYVFAADVEVI